MPDPQNTLVTNGLPGNSSITPNMGHKLTAELPNSGIPSMFTCKVNVNKLGGATSGHNASCYAKMIKRASHCFFYICHSWSKVVGSLGTSKSQDFNTSNKAEILNCTAHEANFSLISPNTTLSLWSSLLRVSVSFITHKAERLIIRQTALFGWAPEGTP